MNIIHRYLTPCLLTVTFTHSLLAATTVTNPTACVLQKLAQAKQDITELITALKAGESHCFRDQQSNYTRSFKLEAGEGDIIQVGLGALELAKTYTPQSVRSQEFNITEETDEFTKNHAAIEKDMTVHISITKIPRTQLILFLQQARAAAQGSK
jgi:hypothetical protein